MILPILYKKTSTGAIQFWEIKVAAGTGLNEKFGSYAIITSFGQLNTDNPQQTLDAILKGKNIGKANETSPQQQAEAEAKSKWEKQKKKGYVESVGAAEAEELDILIEGGIVPMLAHSFADQGHKIKFPAIAQPKLDGIRCLAIVKDGKCTLWSRTRKPITGVPHIAREVERLYGRLDITLDGELYNHSFKKDFEQIVSFVRQEEPAFGHEVVQYHIYDVVTDQTFGSRWFDYLKRLPVEKSSNLFLVPTVECNEADVKEMFDAAVSEGFEGLMLRNVNGKYVNKRSYDLQKVKEFQDDEFEIIGIDEGRGKLAGHVGAFICRTSDGKEFLAKMSGDTAHLKRYFEDHSAWIGKKLTVKYQGLTGANGVPRFPVGIAIRDYE